MQKTHAILMLSIRHLIYVSIYACRIKLIFLMNLKMICISNHNIMLLATSLSRIYSNYFLYGMYEICDCLYVIVLIIIIIIMVIFKCYFSGEHIALSIKKKKQQQQQRCEHRIRKNQQIKSTVHDAN